MRLADAFIPLMTYVLSFRRTAAQAQPPYEQVRGEVIRLLRQSEEYPAKGLCPREDYDQARYAVCAWIDETVLAADWNHKGLWRPELLQRLYYQSADAGEKFFERLGRLGVHQNGIREIYFLCLATGFEGRHCGPEGLAALEQLKAHHLKLLFEGPEEVPTVARLEKEGLFPEASSASALRKAVVSSLRGRLVIAAAAVAGSSLLLLVLFLIYRFSLLTLGDNILKAVNKG